MSADFTIKRGDTRTAMEATLKKSTGAPQDLTGCTVRFRMRAKNASTNKVDKIVTISDATNGVVLVPWDTTDIDTADVYDGEFEVLYPTSNVESFPNDKYVSIEILADFG